MIILLGYKSGPTAWTTNATGNAIGSSSVISFNTAKRTASSNGSSVSYAKRNDGQSTYEITVSSSGDLFYGYSDFKLISTDFSSVFNVSISENVVFLTPADASSLSSFDSTINVSYSISTDISISCNTSVETSSNIVIPVFPDSISVLTGVLLSSFEVLRAGSFEDTSSIKAFFILDGVPLTEHNRKTNTTVSMLNVSSSNWRGKKSVYYKNKSNKKVFNIQWTFVPGKRENTVDLNAGRDYVHNKTKDPRSHVLEIRNLDTNGLTAATTEVYNVLVTEYTENLIRRDLIGDDYYWDCSLSLQEV